MQKQFDEKREVSVKITRTVCDICGDVAKDGSAVIRVQARREESYDSTRPYGIGIGHTPGIDVCSVECLVKNANGIALVLNTKTIPSIDNRGSGNINQASTGGYTLSSTPAGTITWTDGSGSGITRVLSV